MKNDTLEGMRIAILATDGVEQSELTEPRKALEAAGAATKLVAPKAGRIQAMEHDKRGKQFKIDASLEGVKADDFDAVLLPGGALNADALRVDAAAKEFVRRIDREGKPIAAICHAPWLLVSAGLIEGRRLTSYHTIADDVRNAGGTWIDEKVVRDRNWVTSRQPSDLPAFDREMIELFGAHRSEGAKAEAPSIAPPVGR